MPIEWESFEEEFKRIARGHEYHDLHEGMDMEDFDSLSLTEVCVLIEDEFDVWVEYKEIYQISQKGTYKDLRELIIQKVKEKTKA